MLIDRSLIIHMEILMLRKCSVKVHRNRSRLGNVMRTRGPTKKLSAPSSPHIRPGVGARPAEEFYAPARAQ